MLMLDTTEYLKDQGLADQVFTDEEFEWLFDGSPAKRYALMNKALNKKEIIRLIRGVYIIAPKYRSVNFSKFFISTRLVHGSYVSLESALSYHGWIPERVETTTCVIGNGRARTFNTPLGQFKFQKIPTNEYEFLNSVQRKEENGKPFLLATPLRALADYVYEKKIKWTGIDHIIESLRVEEESLESIKTENFSEVMLVYRNKRVLEYLQQLKLALGK